MTIGDVMSCVEFVKRELLYREGVVGTPVDNFKLKENVEGSHCEACKIASPDRDCSACDRNIKVEGEKKAIGDRKQD